MLAFSLLSNNLASKPVVSDPCSYYCSTRSSAEFHCPSLLAALAQMGEALIRGFCKSGVSSVEQISASVRSFDRQRALSNLGLRVYGNALEGGAADLAANSEIIFLGVSYIGSHNYMHAATKICTCLHACTIKHMLPSDSLSDTPKCNLSTQSCRMTVPAVILWCDLLQVKPQYLDTILEALKPHILPSHLVISIAAGIRVASLEAALPEGTRVASTFIPYSINQSINQFTFLVLSTHQGSQQTIIEQTMDTKH